MNTIAVPEQNVPPKVFFAHNLQKTTHLP